MKRWIDIDKKIDEDFIDKKNEDYSISKKL
jgi:hypothetical protein